MEARCQKASFSDIDFSQYRLACNVGRTKMTSGTALMNVDVRFALVHMHLLHVMACSASFQNVPSLLASNNLAENNIIFYMRNSSLFYETRNIFLPCLEPDPQ